MRKPRPCPSYSRRRDRNNCVHWRSFSAERWKVQHYVPTDRTMPSSSITRRSRDTHCPICPARRHSSSSDTAPEAPPQFVRIGQVSLPTLSRNWVELACTSKNANPPHVVHYDEPPAACPPGFEPTTDDVGDKRVSDMLLSDVLCTSRSNHQASPPPAGLSCCCCGLHLVQAFKAQIGHVGRSPVACPPPSPPTVTREPHVFLVCSSPMSSLVLPSLTPVLPSYPSSGGCHSHLCCNPHCPPTPVILSS